MKLTFEKAGELLANQDFRNAMKKGVITDGLADVAPNSEAQAGMTPDNILIITGSTGMADYWKYNFRPNRFVRITEARRRIADSIGYDNLHQGFLLHAAEVLQWLGPRTPSFIVGHSLGAASAQILGTALNVPAITFAAPQVVRRRFLTRPAFRKISHPQWNIFNVAWKQDFVTKGYRFLGLRCLGFRKELDLESTNIGIDHFAKDYQRLLKKDADKGEAREVPEDWRDPSFGVTELP